MQRTAENAITGRMRWLDGTFPPHVPCIGRMREGRSGIGANEQSMNEVERKREAIWAWGLGLGRCRGRGELSGLGAATRDEREQYNGRGREETLKKR
ncbi:uncharacterized protein SPSK_00949 [Sporothrix schenckii 1099-18]|uniref:Uncharacterized protein n=1 Tax=Sporothrix schenckii 1099-18 TaxID=1397361 RepID=A0A0F2LW75_SPOSC|nr:uncharacterized protein SPSK_00949 [Sporothrix schenckii 1099-18]KJR81708.1 hypothetical protein SPSK_00949 [Sporothrix schenckii 1099-18]